MEKLDRLVTTEAFRGVLTYERACLRLQKQEVARLTSAAELVKGGVVAEGGRVVPTGLSSQRAGQARLCPVFRQPAAQEHNSVRHSQRRSQSPPIGGDSATKSLACRRSSPLATRPFRCSRSICGVIAPNSVQTPQKTQNCKREIPTRWRRPDSHAVTGYFQYVDDLPLPRGH